MFNDTFKSWTHPGLEPVTSHTLSENDTLEQRAICTNVQPRTLNINFISFADKCFTILD